MTYCKQADIDGNILEAMEKENHAKQEEQMIVAGYHMFGAQVDKRNKLDACVAFNKSCVTFCYTMSQNLAS